MFQLQLFEGGMLSKTLLVSPALYFWNIGVRVSGPSFMFCRFFLSLVSVTFVLTTTKVWGHAFL